MSNYLKSIRIQRFRSITDMPIKLAPITVFVGANDSGKSNILRAINLFFNDEVVPGYEYDHDRDFSKISTTGTGKANEVKITAKIQSPHHKGLITQVRQWRSDGMQKEKELKYQVPLRPRSKTPLWMARLNYRYIPAIKDRAYMQVLMRELYRLFSDTIDKDMRSGAGAFIGHIRKTTSSISREIKETMQIDSKIQLPQDLSGIFSLLDFETNRKISLNERGDGIRVRHIPAILNFLADRKKQAVRSVRGNAIWGYEEPENNLEMGTAFTQAEKLLKYSKNIQIFITTHSPAFYNLIKRGDCKGYYVSQNESGETSIEEITDPSQMDERMGIMPIIAPYVADVNRQLEKARHALHNAPLAGDRIIFVEGESDKKLIECCLNIAFPDEKDKILVYSCGGASYVPAFIQAKAAESRGQPDIKFVGLLDDDTAGKQASNSGLGKGCKQKIILVNVPKSLAGKGKLSVCIEHLLPLDYWKYAHKEKMLEETNDYREWVDLFGASNGNDMNESVLKAKYCIRDDCKEKFVNYAVRKMQKNGVPMELRDLVGKLISKLGR